MLGNLKRIRLEKGMPQYKLAARTGIRAPRLSIIECQHVRPFISELRRIAPILQTSVEALIDEDIGVIKD